VSHWKTEYLSKIKGLRSGLFSRFPSLYRAYEAFGIKDIRNGTWKLRSRLRLTHGIVQFDGFQMYLDESSYMDLSLYRQYLEDGLYEKETSRYVMNALKEGDVFVDIGANSGYYTLLASSIVGEDGFVYSFEPHPETFKRLSRNVKMNKMNNVKIFNMACSSYDGVGTLNVSKSSDGLNSLKQIPLTSNSIPIEVRKLDTVLPDAVIDMIKIDAEGSEMDIITGASKILSKGKPNIIYEINRGFASSQKIIDVLKEAGFISFAIKNRNLQGEIANIDEIATGTSNIVALRER